MSLVKEVCIRCYDARRWRKWAKQPAKERNWARGRVPCVAFDGTDLVGRYRRVADGPPEGCPYILEHLLGCR